MMEKKHKSGFVNIVGNPNVGKSTLMNRLVGERLSIITSKAQTTRHRIMGIVNTEDMQIVYSDTPGVLRPNYKLQESMLNFSESALGDADVLLYVTDVVETVDKNSDFLRRVERMECPVLLLINKIDQTNQEALEKLVDVWKDMKAKGERLLPYEVIYRLLRSGVLEQYYEIDPKDSWVVAACDKNIPIIVPAWEDCTTGNIFTAHVIKGEFDPLMIKGGIETMMFLTDWYKNNSAGEGVGFFQIGGGTAGDFPICVVPMMEQDLGWKGTPLWAYFCQISDSTTSYGSYSGAVPNEKITWGKLDVDTPRFIVESDATIVAPLMFAYILGW